MEVKIKDLHPTQLYLSEKKLQDIQMICQSAEIINMDPISVLAFGDRLLITDTGRVSNAYSRIRTARAR